MKQKKDSPIKLTDESSQVERSIELSSLIWEGLGQIECLELGYLETTPILENK